MPNTIKATETCIYWQRVVLNQSKDPKQIERAKKAIQNLEEEIKRMSMTSRG